MDTGGKGGEVGGVDIAEPPVGDVVDVDLSSSPAQVSSASEEEKRDGRTHRQLVDGTKRAERLGEMRLELLDDGKEGLIGDDADGDGGGSPARDEGFGVGAGGLDVVNRESGLTPSIASQEERGWSVLLDLAGGRSTTHRVMRERLGSATCECLRSFSILSL